MTDPREDAPSDYEEALERAQEAVSMLSCPAYGQGGRCLSGCWTEPVCHTNEPVDGWVAYLRHAVDDLTETEADR